MNIYKWTDQKFLMHTYESIFGPDSEVLPAEFPSTREINIQIDKWNRLLEELSNRIVVRVPLRQLKRMKPRPKGLTKQQFRDQERLTSQTMQQGKKVGRLANQLFRQYFTE